MSGSLLYVHVYSKQLVFTQRHENERFSSTPYNGVNLYDAPQVFERFSEDNESLVDQVRPLEPELCSSSSSFF